MINHIYPDGVFKPAPAYSQLVKVNIGHAGFLFLVGQVAFDENLQLFGDTVFNKAGKYTEI